MKFGRPIVPRRSTKCVECKTTLEAYTTYLAFDEESDGWLRYDYCKACWEAGKKQGCTWTGTVPPPAQPTPDDEALHLLLQESDPKVRFVLALYLERTKALAKRPELQKKDHLFYEIPHSGEIVEIVPCVVTPQEGEEITRELAMRLDAPSAH